MMKFAILSFCVLSVSAGLKHGNFTKEEEEPEALMTPVPGNNADSNWLRKGIRDVIVPEGRALL